MSNDLSPKDKHMSSNNSIFDPGAVTLGAVT